MLICIKPELYLVIYFDIIIDTMLYLDSML